MDEHITTTVDWYLVAATIVIAGGVLWAGMRLWFGRKSPFGVRGLLLVVAVAGVAVLLGRQNEEKAQMRLAISHLETALEVQQMKADIVQQQLADQIELLEREERADSQAQAR